MRCSNVGPAVRLGTVVLRPAAAQTAQAQLRIVPVVERLPLVSQRHAEEGFELHRKVIVSSL
jgi:hypothetical protein